MKMNPRTAVVCDVHGNSEAFRAVLADIRGKGIERIISLGDQIGYGPDPLGCLELAEEFDVNLMGNHTYTTVYNKAPPYTELSEDIKIGLKFLPAQIRETEDPTLAEKILTELYHLEYLYEEGDILFSHAHPVKPENFIYVRPFRKVVQTVDGKDKDGTQMIFSFRRKYSYFFVGHHHALALIKETDEDPEELPVDQETQTPLSYQGSDRLVAICGSAGGFGVVRDGNPDASYLSFARECDTIDIQCHRVSYDVSGLLDGWKAWLEKGVIVKEEYDLLTSKFQQDG